MGQLLTRIGEGSQGRYYSQKIKMQATTIFCTFLVGLLAIQGIDCLKCKVGISPVTKDMECAGAWDDLKAKLSPIAGKLTDLTKHFNFGSNKSERRRRDTNSTSSTTESPDAYYCLKHSILLSCAPKSQLGIAKALCKKNDDGDETCACNDKDFCNSGTRLASGILILLVALVPFV